MRQRRERKFGFRNSEFGESHTPNPKVKLHPQCAEGASEKPALCTDLPFDEKCSDFAQVAPFFRRNRRQMIEIWAFIGNRRPYPHASDKTN